MASTTEPGFHELDSTPEDERRGVPREIFFVFAGVNVAVTNLAVGALGIVLGLSLMDTLLVYILGAVVGSACVGVCVLQGSAHGCLSHGECATGVRIRRRPDTRGAPLRHHCRLVWGQQLFRCHGRQKYRRRVRGTGRSGSDLVLLAVLTLAARTRRRLRLSTDHQIRARRLHRHGDSARHRGHRSFVARC